MGLFDEFTKGFNAQAFSGFGYETVWAQWKPWFGKLSTNGALKWVTRAASQMPCQVPEYENGFPKGPCSSVALESCLACGRPTCLNHAFLDAQGDSVCYLCVAALGRGSRVVPREAVKEPPPQPPAPDPMQEAKQRAWWARGVLGVQEGVPWPSVKKQHKALSAQYHPDKSGGDETRFKDVQRAFGILKTIYGEN